VEGGPEAIARAAEVAADGGGVEAGVDAREEDDEVFSHEIRDRLVARGEELRFTWFPGSDQCPMHRGASSKGILRQSEDCTERRAMVKMFFWSGLVNRRFPSARLVAMESAARFS